jgi:hypothetical protein
MIENLQWLETWDAVCVTLVRTLPPRDAAAAFSDGGVHEFATFDDAQAWACDEDTEDTLRVAVAAGTVGGWTFLWEDNGFQGVTKQLAVSLSAGSGESVSMFWNVNGVTSFMATRDGVVTRWFEPSFHDEETEGETVGAPLPAEAVIDWESEPVSAGLQLLAAVTGTEVANPSWLRRPGVLAFGVTADAGRSPGE